MRLNAPFAWAARRLLAARMRRTLPLKIATYPADLRADALDALEELAAAGKAPRQPSTAPEAGGSEPLPPGAPKLVGLYGLPRAGKDVAAEVVDARYAHVEPMAFSDVVIAEANEFLHPFGHWITQQNKSLPHYRHLLQIFGVGRRVEDEHYWSRQVAARVKVAWAGGARIVMLTGARAQSDFDVVRALDGEMWKVVRPNSPHQVAHNAAAGAIEGALEHLPDEAWDAIILNDREGDLGHYAAQVHARLHARAAA